MTHPPTPFPPTPLPPPPRAVRPSRGGLARWGSLLVVVAGLALVGAIAARWAVRAWGRPVTATVDRLAVDGDRRTGTRAYTVGFHYTLDGRRYDDQQEVTATELAARHAGDAVAGRAVVAFGHGLALTAAGDAGRVTDRLAGATVVTLGAGLLFAYGAFVPPWRTRRLLATGTAAAGVIVAEQGFHGRRGVAGGGRLPVRHAGRPRHRRPDGRRPPAGRHGRRPAGHGRLRPGPPGPEHGLGVRRVSRRFVTGPGSPHPGPAGAAFPAGGPMVTSGRPAPEPPAGHGRMPAS